MRKPLFLSIALSLLALSSSAFAHEGDFFIGRTGADQLAVEFDSAAVFELPQVVLIPGDGWGADDPGFAALDVDEPDEDFYMLAPAAQVALELVAIDADFVMWDAPPTQPALESPGDQWNLPVGNAFDTHGFWFVDDPDFSELGATFSITFKLIDRGGTYADSGAYTAMFTPVPEPGAFMLALVAALALRRLARA